MPSCSIVSVSGARFARISEQRASSCSDDRVHPDAAPVRLFLALWPEPAALRALLAWHAGWAWPPGAAVVAPERLHLTLHFIGSVPAQHLPGLVPGLACPCPRFDLDLDVAESWPRGLAVLRPSAVPTALIELHAQLGIALQRLGLPIETRAFRPHVTLARKAARAVPPAQPLAGVWPVRRYALVQSLGGYRSLAWYPR